MKNYPQTLIRTKAICAATAFVVAAISFSGAASAQTSNTDMSVKINKAHLDLTSEAGAEVLYRKIKNAAAKICGGKTRPRQLAQRRLHQTCIDDIVDKTVYKADIPMLVAIHTGEPLVNTRLFAKNEAELKTQKTP